MEQGLAMGMLLRRSTDQGLFTPSLPLTSQSKPDRWDLRKANLHLCLSSLQLEQQGSKPQRGYS